MAEANNNITNVEGLPLRQDLTEIHYAQLFFAVGHVAIKMLSFVEQIESDLKKAVADSFQKKKKQQS